MTLPHHTVDLKSQEKQSPYFKLNGWTDFQVQNLGFEREKKLATTARKDSLEKNFLCHYSLKPGKSVSRDANLRQHSRCIGTMQVTHSLED